LLRLLYWAIFSAGEQGMAAPSNFQPAGWHTVTPRIIVHGAGRLVEPYGDRRGMVKDPWGNIWQIATRRQS
jgi:hypothetical protein